MWTATTVNNTATAVASAGTATTTSTTIPPKTFGMTSAISEAEPKPIDLVRTNELMESLKPYNVFETEEELNHRMEILR